MVELVMAMGVSAIIVSGSTATIYQVFMNNAQNTAHMTAVKQVENALHFMVRDIQMSQNIQTDNLTGDEILKLRWIDWDNTTYQVIYSLTNGELFRNYSLGGQTTVSRYIATLDVSPKPYGNGKVTVSISVTIGGARPASETREVEILPRSNS